MKHEDKQLLKRTLKQLAPHKKKIVLVVSCFLLLTVLTFFRPMVIKSITDDGMINQNMTLILLLSGILFLLSLVEQSVELGQTKLFLTLQNDVQFSLYKESFQKLLHLKMSYYTDKNNTGIINSLSTDINKVGLIADRGIMFLFNYIFRIISGLLGLFIISWKLALLVLLAVPIKYIFVRLLSDKKRDLMVRALKNARDFSSWFGENINGIREIKLWNLYNQKFGQFQDKHKKVIADNKNSGMLDAWNSTYELLLSAFMTSLLYIVGGLLICRGELSVGDVIAFLSYSSYVLSPISAIMNMKMILAAVFPSAKRLFGFLDQEESESGGEEPCGNSFKGICFDHVRFSYGDKELLQDINMLIPCGAKAAIIGQNGSGKTTLINLLLRLIQPDEGRIIMDGKDISEYDLNSYRELFSVVSQDPFLFQDTVRNNIDLRQRDKKDEIETVCAQSGVEGFLDKLPNGLDSKLGRNGTNLSGGEKQKLAVARALIKDAPVVILDEATSNFDVDSDAFLHDVIMEFKDKTIIMITHKYENLKGFDLIYRIENGYLIPVERGQEYGNCRDY
ncbi:ABC transporter ATP-binding protein [Anaerolentibacter hominis]|uniref:ABC transporter ATP-binding protein n=1 Tax=Anaerolentibacter hominis TaxID=3079009 RepID=UPI0031B83ACA